MKTLTNNNTKTVLVIFMATILVSALSAQTVVPVSKATGKVTYRFSIPVDGSMTNEEAYEMAGNWLNHHTQDFTRSNVSVSPDNMSGVNSSRLAEVEHEFKNTSPVQSLDPASNRITVRGVTKYFGEKGSNIHALYLQYYMVVTVENHQIICELSDFRYNHFNERSFQFKRILNWSNSTSLDPVSTLEYLVENEQSHTEFNKFYSFLNTDLNRMIANFSTAVKTKAAIAQN